MRRLFICSILLLMVGGCAAPSKKKSMENFMVKRGTNLSAKGSRYLEKGCFEEAVAYFTLAYQNFQASDYLAGMAQALNNLAVSLLGSEEPEKAELFASRALVINRNLGDSLGQAANLSVLGKVHMNKEENEDAQRLWQEALEKAHKGSVELRSRILNDLGVASIRSGKINEARTHLNQALTLNPDSAAVHQNLGKVAELSENISNAETYYLKALALDRKQGYTPGIAADLTVLGNLYLKMERKSEAAEVLARAIGLRTLLNQKDKADALREDLRRAGLDAGTLSHKVGEEEIPPPCR